MASLVSRALNTVRLLDRPSHLRRIARSRRILATLVRFRGEGAGARADQWSQIAKMESKRFSAAVSSLVCPTPQPCGRALRARQSKDFG